MEPRRYSGKTVDEATDIALAALNVNREDVEIVVVNPGRSGILGFGGEPAEIEVTLIDDRAGAHAATRMVTGEDEWEDDEDLEDGGEDEDLEYEDEEDEYDDSEEWDEEDLEDEEEFEEYPDEFEEPEDSVDLTGEGEREGAVAIAAPTARHAEDRGAESQEEVIEFATEVIDYFLASMGVVAETYLREEFEDGVPVFDVEGEDAGLLIGRRGETLQAFQYLVNLIVTSQLGRSAYVQIDVEGYKERRRETLANLAKRTAARVATSGRPAELEPMPAYERRWIHVALSDHPQVRTESQGEGADRYVVIHPKNGSGGGGRRRRRR